ncbi:CrcB family protein [uncultured Agrococcus sp.]|uniref:fluoride efflux transporter FluC n=1 Tax=uncultured Agrococcus sp. TaxID=382258 RepID=UPI0025FDA63B|nr:CrcB family protein [uncultured Agrococcus sp.]
MPYVFLAVALGGAAGSVARAAIDQALPTDPLPWGTLLVNTVGSLVIGLLSGGLQHAWPKWLQQGATTGFLGGFTTYSAFALWLTADDLDHWSLIIGASAAVAGILTALAGILLGERMSGRMARHPVQEESHGWIAPAGDDTDAEQEEAAEPTTEGTVPERSLRIRFRRRRR